MINNRAEVKAAALNPGYFEYPSRIGAVYPVTDGAFFVESDRLYGQRTYRVMLITDDGEMRRADGDDHYTVYMARQAAAKHANERKNDHVEDV